MKKILLIASFAALMLGFTAYQDIDYYPEGEAPQPDKNKLDIFVPDDMIGEKPVIFFVHGGTWMYNDRSDFSLLGEIMADDEDYITVIPSYRLSDSLHPEVVYPNHIEDVAQAFAWIVENIASYGGDVDNIVVMGHSAGGHLATLLVTNTDYINAAGASIDDVRCLVCFSMGVYDIPKLYEDAGMWAPIAWPYTPFGAIFTDDEEIWEDASPRYHLHENMPPSIFLVAENDMEHIIGGDWFGMGMIFLDGEIQYVYNHFNEYQPTDTFWIEGDHDTSFGTFVYTASSRARNVTMNFIDHEVYGIEEKALPDRIRLSAYPNPFNSALHIEGEGKARIFDASGRLACELSLPGTWRPDAESGLYIIEDEKGEKNKVYYVK